jgi:hypothetical protein
LERPLIKLVRELDDELVREHRYDTALFAELTELQRSSGILHGERPISPFLRPYFLESSRYRSIQRAAASISDAFEAMTAAALVNPELSDILDLSEKELRFARIDPGYRATSITGRLDTFLDDAGFKFLEYNAENPAGIGDQLALEKLYSHVPLVGAFLQANANFFPQPQIGLISAIDSVYREWGGKKPKPNIAIVDWEGVDTAPEFEILREFFESAGYATVICDPSELEYAGGALLFGGFEVDVLYKRVIIHEFLERFDETHPIARAMAAGAVCMVNAFRSKVPHKKSSFAIVTDPKYSGLFTPQQLGHVRQHIPWTRRVREGWTTFKDETIDLAAFMRSNRDRLVLKPNDDYGGKGISIGWECTESEWDDAIDIALAQPFVVQERVNVEKTRIALFSESEAHVEELNVDFDPFLFNGTVEGGLVRLAASSLVNITQGGGEAGLAIVDGV